MGWLKPEVDLIDPEFRGDWAHLRDQPGDPPAGPATITARGQQVQGLRIDGETVTQEDFVLDGGFDICPVPEMMGLPLMAKRLDGAEASEEPSDAMRSFLLTQLLTAPGLGPPLVRSRHPRHVLVAAAAHSSRANTGDRRGVARGRCRRCYWRGAMACGWGRVTWRACATSSQSCARSTCRRTCRSSTTPRNFAAGFRCGVTPVPSTRRGRQTHAHTRACIAECACANDSCVRTKARPQPLPNPEQARQWEAAFPDVEPALEARYAHYGCIAEYLLRLHLLWSRHSRRAG